MTSIAEEKDQIREVLARYCFYTDSGDSDSWAGLFTEDCLWDGGPFGVQRGREALRAFSKQSAETARTMKHCTTNIVIRVNGEEARSRSYVTVLGKAETGAAIFFAGHYCDHLIKRDGRWLIKTRMLRAELSDIPMDF